MSAMRLFDRSGGKNCEMVCAACGKLFAWNPQNNNRGMCSHGMKHVRAGEATVNATYKPYSAFYVAEGK